MTLNIAHNVMMQCSPTYAINHACNTFQRDCTTLGDQLNASHSIYQRNEDVAGHTYLKSAPEEPKLFMPKYESPKPLVLKEPELEIDVDLILGRKKKEEPLFTHIPEPEPLLKYEPPKPLIFKEPKPISVDVDLILGRKKKEDSYLMHIPKPEPEPLLKYEPPKPLVLKEPEPLSVDVDLILGRKKEEPSYLNLGLLNKNKEEDDMFKSKIPEYEPLKLNIEHKESFVDRLMRKSLIGKKEEPSFKLPEPPKIDFEALKPKTFEIPKYEPPKIDVDALLGRKKPKSLFDRLTEGL